MNSKDKRRVQQAAQHNGSESSNAKANRSQQNAQVGADKIQDKIAQARRKVADSTKAQIIGGGIADALTEIAHGDYGDMGESVFEAFDAFIDELDNSRMSLEAAESDPKFLLTGSSTILDAEYQESSKTQEKTIAAN